MWTPAVECECESGPCTAAPSDPIALGAEVPIGEWATCPRALARHPMLAAAAQVDAIAEISPLAQWPDTWAAGVVQCLQALHAERRWALAQQTR